MSDFIKRFKQQKDSADETSLRENQNEEMSRCKHPYDHESKSAMRSSDKFAQVAMDHLQMFHSGFVSCQV